MALTGNSVWTVKSDPTDFSGMCKAMRIGTGRMKEITSQTRRRMISGRSNRRDSPGLAGLACWPKPPLVGWGVSKSMTQAKPNNAEPTHRIPVFFSGFSVTGFADGVSSEEKKVPPSKIT